MADLDVFVDFYTRVLGFQIVDNRRHAQPPRPRCAVALHESGAIRPWVPVDRSAHELPTGALVLETDDSTAERDRVVAAGWFGAVSPGCSGPRNRPCVRMIMVSAALPSKEYG